MICKLAGCPEIASRKDLMEKDNSVRGDGRVEGRAEKGAEVGENDIGRTMSLSETIIEQVGRQKDGGLHIPPDFRCPLSLELMCDPVIVASGQTYERAYIQQWLEQGNTTCPKTRQTLTHTNLIPNYTVKALIANWCEGNSVSLIETVKTDTFNAILRPLSPVTSVKDELELRRIESPPRIAQFKLVEIQQRSQKLGMSSVDCVPPARSRCSFHSDSLDTRELETEAPQDYEEEHGKESPPAVGRNLVLHHLDGDVSLQRISLLKGKHDAGDPHNFPSPVNHDCWSGSSSSIGSIVEGGQGSFTPRDDMTTCGLSGTTLDSSPFHSDVSGELDRLSISSALTSFTVDTESPVRQGRMGGVPWRRIGEEREISLPRIVPSPMQDAMGVEGTPPVVDELVFDLQADDFNIQRQAASALRLLAKYNMENRIIIANSGAIKPLVALLSSTDSKTQENAVTALLNLSINDNNKTEIAAAGAIDPLVNVLKVGTAQAMENAAATLFSLSVMDDNKVTIGASGAIPPLVHLLIHGTPRGKKDAATALFNLSIFHENKARIVRAGAIKPLVELMADPAAGMVDKAVAVVANLATIPEGRVAIGEEGGIPALVEVVEAGSQRGKENAAAALLQLCMNSHKHRALVLQEGAIPPLVALSQSGTARAKEKASALLRHFREQRHQVLGPRSGPDRHAMGQY